MVSQEEEVAGCPAEKEGEVGVERGRWRQGQEARAAGSLSQVFGLQEILPRRPPVGRRVRERDCKERPRGD